MPQRGLAALTQEPALLAPWPRKPTRSWSSLAPAADVPATARGTTVRPSRDEIRAACHLASDIRPIVYIRSCWVPAERCRADQAILSHSRLGPAAGIRYGTQCDQAPRIFCFCAVELRLRHGTSVKEFGLAGDLDCLLRMPAPVGQKRQMASEPGCCVASREATAGTVPVFPKDARTAPPWRPFRLTLPRQMGQLARNYVAHASRISA